MTNTSMYNEAPSLIFICYADNDNLLIARARQTHGAYVVTNIKTGRKEVYGLENKIVEVKEKLYINS